MFRYFYESLYRHERLERVETREIFQPRTAINSPVFTYLANSSVYLENVDDTYSLTGQRVSRRALIYFTCNSYGKSGCMVAGRISDDLFARK